MTVFRLATQAEWAAMQNLPRLPWTSIDRQDGFFHLSTKAQLRDTAARYFSAHVMLTALEFSAEQLGEALRFEAVAARGGALFPHYYGEIARGDISRVHVVQRRPEGHYLLTDEIL